MNCRNRDADLLLFGLGELSSWQRWKTALHLQTCARCRSRQSELASVSGRIASVLEPPGGHGGTRPGSGLPTAMRPALPFLAPVVLFFILGALTVSVVSVWYFHSRAVAAPAQPSRDTGCRPDLHNDLCR